MTVLVLAKEHTAFLAAVLSRKITASNVPNNLLFFSYGELFYEFPSLSLVRKSNCNVDHLLNLEEIADLKKSTSDVSKKLESIQARIATKNYSIQNAILTSQFFSQGFHQRDFYFPVSSEFKAKYICYIWEQIEAYFKEKSIKQVISLNNDTLETYLIEAFCACEDISYNYLEYTRSRGVWYWNNSGSICHGPNVFIPSATKGMEPIQSVDVKWDDYKKNNTFREGISFGSWLSECLRVAKLTIKLELTKRKKKFAVNELLASNYRYAIYHFKKFPKFLRYKALTSKYRLDGKDLEDTKYFFFPLHYIPESTVFTSSPNSFDQLNIIKSISKELLPGEILLLKEHGQMLGETEVNFYKQVNKLGNIRWLDRADTVHPKSVLKNCCGVITLTGSTALEAAVEGKPALIFGYTPFSHLTSVTEFSGCMAASLNQLRQRKTYETAPLEVKQYNEHFDRVGAKLDLISLYSSGEEVLDELDSDNNAQIEQILSRLPKI